MEGTGIMLLEANSTPEEAPKVLRLLRSELDSLLNDGIHEDELKRAKDKWISSIVLSSESTFARMRSLASDWVTEGRLVSVEEEIERVEKIELYAKDSRVAVLQDGAQLPVSRSGYARLKELLGENV